MYCSRCLLGSTWPIVARFVDWRRLVQKLRPPGCVGRRQSQLPVVHVGVQHAENVEMDTFPWNHLHISASKKWVCRQIGYPLNHNCMVSHHSSKSKPNSCGWWHRSALHPFYCTSQPPKKIGAFLYDLRLQRTQEGSSCCSYCIAVLRGSIPVVPRYVFGAWEQSLTSLLTKNGSFSKHGHKMPYRPYRDSWWLVSVCKYRVYCWFQHIVPWDEWRPNTEAPGDCWLDHQPAQSDIFQLLVVSAFARDLFFSIFS